MMDAKYIKLTHWLSKNPIYLRVSDIAYWLSEDSKNNEFTRDKTYLGSTYIFLKHIGRFNVVESLEQIKGILDGV